VDAGYLAHSVAFGPASMIRVTGTQDAKARSLPTL
jgi:hypothetical protein